MAVSQQVFLRDAMRRLNLTRDVFAARIGVKRRALDTWLLPEGSQEYRGMPEVVQRFVTEIVENEALLMKYAQNSQSGPLRDRIAIAGKHQLLSVEQFTRESVEELVRIADIMQPVARRQKVSRVLEGAVLGNLFFEASTRTRVSFGAAFCRLGGSVCDTTGFTFSSMAKGESIYDTSRVMSGYVDAMVVRHPEQGSVAEFAAATNIPVVNGGDGAGEHPSQALLDLYTILTEFSRLGKLLDGAHIAITGDLKYGRTVHSLMKMLSLYKRITFTLISPSGLEMQSDIIDYVAARGDHTIEQTDSMRAGLANADVIYATRVQKERFSEEQLAGYSADFQINKALIATYAKKDVIIMHPLPRDSREDAHDLSVDLNYDPRLAIFRQADNGIPVRMAIFAVLLGVDNLVQHSLRDVTWSPPSHIGPEDAVFHGMY